MCLYRLLTGLELGIVELFGMREAAIDARETEMGAIVPNWKLSIFILKRIGGVEAKKGSGHNQMFDLIQVSIQTCIDLT